MLLTSAGRILYIIYIYLTVTKYLSIDTSKLENFANFRKSHIILTKYRSIVNIYLNQFHANLENDGTDLASDKL